MSSRQLNGDTLEREEGAREGGQGRSACHHSMRNSRPGRTSNGIKCAAGQQAVPDEEERLDMGAERQAGHVFACLALQHTAKCAADAASKLVQSA